MTLQSDLLADLATVGVAPLIREEGFGKPADLLSPVFSVEEQRVVLSTAELAGISKQDRGVEVSSLAESHEAIVAALDLLFTGI